MNITTTVRSCLVAATIATAGLATTACGDGGQPASPEIGVELPEPDVKRYEPACNTPAAVRPCPKDTWPGPQVRDREKSDEEFRPGL